MPRYLVDEDLPRSLTRALNDAGVSAEDVRDIGLRGPPDREVLAVAIARDAALVSADLGFANLLAFPLGTHRGIVVVRFPNDVTTEVVNRHVVDVLRRIEAEELAGSLIIVEPTRVRLRQPGTRT